MTSAFSGKDVELFAFSQAKSDLKYYFDRSKKIENYSLTSSMFRLRAENVQRLHSHNITLSKINHQLGAMSESQAPRKLINLPKVRMVSKGPHRINPNIRITNIIKPPDPEVQKKQEEDRLRAQLQKEIVSRSRSCAFKQYACSLPVLLGQQYCARHVLTDPEAPFKPCAHEKCPAPVPTSSDQALCFSHARAALLSRQRAAAPPPPVASAETMLNQLQHYVRPERARTASCTSSVSVVSEPSEQESSAATALEPFKQIDATAINASYSASIIECASASDSDGDSVVVGGPEGARADPSAECEVEDAPTETQPLWHAGVFTAEEAVGEAKSALRALHSGYIEQMARLHTLLKMERRRYLKDIRVEREHCCSINSQSLSGGVTGRERRQLKKLKAYAGYRRRHGVHAVLQRKLYYRRAKVSGPTHKIPATQSRCVFSEGGVRCATNTLPAAKHCIKHITHHPHQVLFTACGDSRGGVSCREVIPKLPHAPFCVYHTDPPAYTMFTLKKDDSDSDTDSNCSTGSQLTVDDQHAAPPL